MQELTDQLDLITAGPRALIIMRPRKPATPDQLNYFSKAIEKWRQMHNVDIPIMVIDSQLDVLVIEDAVRKELRQKGVSP